MDNKPYLYWHIQHLDQIGGTEMVSTDLMNHLADSFHIVCIVTAKVENEVVYNLDKSIKLFYLNIPQDVTRLDAYALKNKKEKKGYKNIGLFFKAAHYFFFKKHKYRKIIKKLINEHPGKLISSSGDSYMFAPKGVYSIFHFHFNSRNYFTFGNKMLLKMSRKPDQIVFLTKSTMDEVLRKQKLKSKVSYIYNPIRFEGEEHFDVHNNKIVFLGRFSEQKNPLFALEIINKLKETNLNFSFDMYGDGPLKEPMEKYIKEHNLENVVTIYPMTSKVKEVLRGSDLLLLTSRYEGFVLVKGEANALSVPCISTYFGDSTIEMFENGKDGYYLTSNEPADFANKIYEILSNKDTLIELKKSSLKRSEDLSYTNIIPIWKDLLK